LELLQQLEQRIKQDFYDFRRLAKEGRLDVLFNYGLDTTEIQFFMKLDDAGIKQMAKNTQLASTNPNYIKMLIDSHEKTIQAALNGANREAIEAIRTNSMQGYES